MKSHHDSSVFLVLRWISRVVGTAFVLFIVFMLLSYTFGEEKSVPSTSMFVIFFLLVLGVGLAWRWEGLGGLILLVSSLIFFILNPHVTWPPGLYHIMPLVAFLFLLCWFGLRCQQKGTLEDR
jgi:hypothetical protein